MASRLVCLMGQHRGGRVGDGVHLCRVTLLAVFGGLVLVGLDHVVDVEGVEAMSMNYMTDLTINMHSYFED